MVAIDDKIELEDYVPANAEVIENDKDIDYDPTALAALELTNPEIEIYKGIANKIQYANFAPLVNRKYHVGQAQVIRFLDEHPEVPYITMVCGRRFGKSILVSDIVSGELMIPNASVLLLAPTYQNAEILFSAVLKNMNEVGIKFKSKNANQLTFRLENGSSFISASQKTIKSVLGSRISLFVVDESQDIEDLDTLFTQYVQPAQADFGVRDDTQTANARAIFIGTARTEEIDFFAFSQMSGKDNQWKNFSFPTSTNPLISQAFIDNKEKNLTPEIFGQEYMAQWQRMTGEVVVYAFDPEKHVVSKETVAKVRNGSGYRISALDVGFEDNFGYLYAVIEAGTGNIYITSEYKKSKATTSVHISEMQKIEEREGTTCSVRYRDPANAQFGHDAMMDHQFFTLPALNAIDDGFKAVNTHFHNGKLYVSEDCIELIGEMRNMVWAGPKKVKRTKRYKHFDLALSTLRYLVFSHIKMAGAGDCQII